MNIFRWLFPPHKWTPGEYAKIMVHAQTTWMYFYVKIIRVEGNSIRVDYLNNKLMSELKADNPSWWFINPIYRKELIQLAYDEQREALKVEEESPVDLIDQMIAELDEDTHRRRHIELHKSFDELMADFIGHTDKLPLETNLIEFLEWSYGQTKSPTEGKTHE